ncbi:hypothetical protein [Frankia tisae]|uniref:hypothetical protein n=1 Tax=Frankia tisae TaxID=2950104 RepID=UPI0021C23D81|nr:hypothetical protein [Frankia tisae]
MPEQHQPARRPGSSTKVDAIRAEMIRRRTAPPDPDEVRQVERRRRPVQKIREAIDSADPAALRTALLAAVDACTFPGDEPQLFSGDVLEAVGVALGTRKPRRGKSA